MQVLKVRLMPCPSGSQSWKSRTTILRESSTRHKLRMVGRSETPLVIRDSIVLAASSISVKVYNLCNAKGKVFSSEGLGCHCSACLSALVCNDLFSHVLDEVLASTESFEHRDILLLAKAELL